MWRGFVFNKDYYPQKNLSLIVFKKAHKVWALMTFLCQKGSGKPVVIENRLTPVAMVLHHHSVVCNCPNAVRQENLVQRVALTTL